MELGMAHFSEPLAARLDARGRQVDSDIAVAGAEQIAGPSPEARRDLENRRCRQERADAREKGRVPLRVRTTPGRRPLVSLIGPGVLTAPLPEIGLDVGHGRPGDYIGGSGMDGGGRS